MSRGLIGREAYDNLADVPCAEARTLTSQANQIHAIVSRLRETANELAMRVGMPTVPANTLKSNVAEPPIDLPEALSRCENIVNDIGTTLQFIAERL